MKKLLIAASTALFVFTSQAYGQQRCADASAIISYLFETFKEMPVWQGFAQNGTHIVLMQSGTGSWTLLAVKDGLACLLATGVGGDVAKGA